MRRTKHTTRTCTACLRVITDAVNAFHASREHLEMLDTIGTLEDALRAHGWLPKLLEDA